LFDLQKLVPKLPDAAIHYWDCFTGLCFVLAGLYQAVNSSSGIGWLVSGFGLITFSMARQCFRYVGAVRLHVCSAQYKRSLAYPKLLASVFWLTASWVCFRYAMLNFHITEQWLRWVLHY
jgi:hypothetical protein